MNQSLWIQIIARTMVSFVAATSITACIPKTVKSAPTCLTPETKHVDQAFEQARKSLSNRACHYQFDTVHNQLIEIAQGDPSKDNKKRFYDFYQWITDQGIISKNQSKMLFTRYFTTQFSNALPDNQNTCSHRSTKETMVRNLAQEMKYKKVGLQDIIGNRDLYFRAVSKHNDLVFLIETTMLACST